MLFNSLFLKFKSIKNLRANFLYAILLVIIFCIIIVSYLYLIKDEGINISDIELINSNNKIVKLHEILDEKEYLFFYSDDCNTCEKIIPLISRNYKILMICLDRPIENGNAEWSIYKNKILKIKYVPYILNINRNCTVIREIALIQFLTIIKSES